MICIFKNRTWTTWGVIQNYTNYTNTNMNNMIIQNINTGRGLLCASI